MHALPSCLQDEQAHVGNSLWPSWQAGRLHVTRLGPIRWDDTCGAACSAHPRPRYLMVLLVGDPFLIGELH